MYPRSVPVKPPPASGRSQEARLRRWLLWLTVGTVIAVVLLVVVGAVGFYWLVKGARSADKPAVALLPTAPASQTQEVRASSPTTPATAPPTVPVKEEKPATTVVAPKERTLEALGTLSGAHLYQCFLNIGVLADATENDVYSEAEATKLLDQLTTLMETVDQQLAKLAETGLEADDLKKLERSRQLSALLRTEAKELRAYWNTPDTDKEAKKDHETRYHKTRDEAWAGIRELLGIKE